LPELSDAGRGLDRCGLSLRMRELLGREPLLRLSGLLRLGGGLLRVGGLLG
jgi:hypothetical protein